MKTAYDKRKFTRIPETVAITVRKIVYPMTDEAAVGAVGKNISAGGICFTVSRPYEPGDLLNTQINLAGWQRHKTSYAALIDESDGPGVHVAHAPHQLHGELLAAQDRG